MKKNTLIRNDSPHEVKVREGSNVAEHRGSRVKGAAEPLESAQPIEPVFDLPAEEAPAPAKVKKRSPAKPRIKPRLTPQAGILPPSLQAAIPEPEAVPVPAPAQALPLLPLIEAEALWEQDNPVKERLTALRTRNALLTEQIQRLHQPQKARGK
ncbi:MAG: hypothetical protein KAY21_01415 [Limnohabitans sp.]|nr:hypothetical protein [Limnohabitans sp.]